MPFTLPLYVYKVYQQRYQKEFEKTNTILNTSDIEDLLKTQQPDKIIRIFKSAIVTHEPVDGTPYYLSAPVAPLFYHDAFKRCLIAEALGNYASEHNLAGMEDAVSVLNCLKDVSMSGYVQIFAWHALGRWALHDPKVIEFCRESIAQSLAGSTASVLGVLVFLDHIRCKISNDMRKSILEQGASNVRYKVQNALFGYYWIKQGLGRPNFINDKNISDFLSQYQISSYVSETYFERGLKEIGLVPNHSKGGIYPGTQQADVSFRIKSIASSYISVVGHYLRTAWD